MEGEVAGVWFHIAAGRVLYFVVELKNEGKLERCFPPLNGVMVNNNPIENNNTLVIDLRMFRRDRSKWPGSQARFRGIGISRVACQSLHASTLRKSD